MPRKWTPEQKARQAEAIRRWKPWERSTGPKTAAGKARCKINAYKNGMHSAAMVEIKRVLRLQAKYLRGITEGLSSAMPLVPEPPERTIKAPWKNKAPPHPLKTPERTIKE